ncbi:MAG: hypothetical protein LBB58_02775 [Cellulomonadaceae bacterium]|jgi:adenylate cyclase|nr:hypothetical protein [Cellulomonadaceae bacterium]
MPDGTALCQTPDTNAIGKHAKRAGVSATWHGISDTLTIVTTNPAPNASQSGLRKLNKSQIIKDTDLSLLGLLSEQIEEVVFGKKPEFTLDELAEQTGWSAEQLEKLWLWAGLAHTPDRLYTRSDVSGLIELRSLAEQAHLDDKTLAALVRSTGAAMERLAAWQVEVIIQFLAERSSISDTEARIEAATYGAKASQELVKHLIPIWLNHYRSALQRLTTDAVIQRGTSDDDLEFPLLRAVGYAQITDFHAQTDHLEVPEFKAYVQNFHDIYSDIVHSSGGRIIKRLGDGLLYVADDTSSGADIALKLVNLNAEGFSGSIHVGLSWGRMVFASDSVFSPGVELAFSLARMAPPNSIYLDSSAATILARYPKYYTVALVHQADPEVDKAFALTTAPAAGG